MAEISLNWFKLKIDWCLNCGGKKANVTGTGLLAAFIQKSEINNEIRNWFIAVNESNCRIELMNFWIKLNELAAASPVWTIIYTAAAIRHPFHPFINARNSVIQLNSNCWRQQFEWNFILISALIEWWMECRMPNNRT